MGLVHPVNIFRIRAQDLEADERVTIRAGSPQVLGVVAFLGMVLGPFPVSGYRFLYDDTWSEPEPVQWSDEVWGPGETLSFRLVEDSTWLDGFSSLGAVEELIEEAMSGWSGISTADIRWNVSGTATERDPDISEVYLEHGYAPGAGGALIGTRNSPDGRRRIDVCDIYLAPGQVTRSKDDILNALIHELGHCLGLHHAGALWTRDVLRYRVALPTAWSADPTMSYGRLRGGTITADDRVGASLLRPAAGWEATTGSIRGSVLVKDEGGAAAVHVVATRLDGQGDMVESVGVFTNVHGEFLIRGLAPGAYSLLVRPLTIPQAHGGLRYHAEADIRDTLQTAPVTVRAGTIAGPVAITVRRGDYRW